MADNRPDEASTAAFKILNGHVVELFSMWLMHKGLYRDDKTLQNMNRVSPAGFSLIRNALTHEIIRLICALTDIPGSGKYSNLSLLGIVATLSVGKAADEASRAAENACATSEVIRTHRNKRLMHFDKDTKLTISEYFAAEVSDPTTRPLPAISWETIDKCVECIGDAASKISVALGNAAIAYEWTDISNAPGALGWAVRDSLRLTHLRSMSHGTEVDDATLRRLVQQRSDRRDSEILKTISSTQREE